MTTQAKENLPFCFLHFDLPSLLVSALGFPFTSLVKIGLYFSRSRSTPVCIINTFNEKKNIHLSPSIESSKHYFMIHVLKEKLKPNSNDIQTPSSAVNSSISING